MEHREEHFTASEIVRDAVLGMADGLTVPFALAAGLAGAANASHLVVAAGLAEISAGSIAMGLGGYLAARSQAEHYDNERAREQQEILEKPRVEMEEVATVFRSYGLTEEEIRPVVRALRERPQAWIDFMMRFELGMEKPQPRRALISAIVIGSAYVVGGLIPLAPYMLTPVVSKALWISTIVTGVALLVFGFIRGRFAGVRPVRSALQTLLIGGLAATVAFFVARLFT